jgi:hypothetical protein
VPLSGVEQAKLLAARMQQQIPGSTASSQLPHPVVHVIHLSLRCRPPRPAVLRRGLSGGSSSAPLLPLPLLRFDGEGDHHGGQLVAEAVEAVVLSICGWVGCEEGWGRLAVDSAFVKANPYWDMHRKFVCGGFAEQ